jgi:hypothetical protein
MTSKQHLSADLPLGKMIFEAHFAARRSLL